MICEKGFGVFTRAVFQLLYLLKLIPLQNWVPMDGLCYILKCWSRASFHGCQFDWGGWCHDMLVGMNIFNTLRQEVLALLGYVHT